MDSAARIRELCEPVIRDKIPVFLNCSALLSSYETKILECDGGLCVLKNTIPPDQIREFVRSQEFRLQAGMTKFVGRLVRSDGENILFRVDEIEAIRQMRSEERQMPDPSLVSFCEIRNPVDNVTILRKPVLDMTQSGFSFLMKHDSQLFEIGRIFNNVQIFSGSQLRTKGNYRVIYKRKLVRISKQVMIQVGLSHSEA